jgi:hypothetical protein
MMIALTASAQTTATKAADSRSLRGGRPFASSVLMVEAVVDV